MNWAFQKEPSLLQKHKRKDVVNFIGLGLLQKEFTGCRAEALLIDVDLDVHRIIDDIVERQENDACLVGFPHDGAKSCRVVGVDDDGVKALIDEIVRSGDLVIDGSVKERLIRLASVISN